MDVIIKATDDLLITSSNALSARQLNLGKMPNDLKR